MSLLKVKFGNRTYLAKYDTPLNFKLLTYGIHYDASQHIDFPRKGGKSEVYDGDDTQMTGNKSSYIGTVPAFQISSNNKLLTYNVGKLPYPFTVDWVQQSFDDTMARFEIHVGDYTVAARNRANSSNVGFSDAGAKKCFDNMPSSKYTLFDSTSYIRLVMGYNEFLSKTSQSYSTSKHIAVAFEADYITIWVNGVRKVRFENQIDSYDNIGVAFGCEYHVTAPVFTQIAIRDYLVWPSNANFTAPVEPYINL